MNKEPEVASAVFNAFNYKIFEAIKLIQDGICQRVDINEKVKVYECKNIIRIDIKK